MTTAQKIEKYQQKADRYKELMSEHNREIKPFMDYQALYLLCNEIIADLDTLPECKTEHHNDALNLLMNLSNAAGADFEDEQMAVELIKEALSRTNECSGKVIDYVKETCTSCGCKNHKTE